MTTLTQERLKDLLNYNPETGVFTRKIALSNRNKVGDIISRYSNGYLEASIGSKRHQMHRLAFFYMTGEWPKEQVDHINHVRDDNRWVNLRLVTHSENLKNQKLHNHNTSGVSGVCWDKQYQKWRCRINNSGKAILLGLTSDFFNACCIRKSAERKYGFHENHGRVML